MKIATFEVVEFSLQLYNLERYVQAGISPSTQLTFGTVYCFSLAAVVWMFRSEKLWVHRDGVLMLDVGTDAFYSFIFPLTIAVIALIARGSLTEEEGAFWVATVR